MSSENLPNIERRPKGAMFFNCDHNTAITASEPPGCLINNPAKFKNMLQIAVRAVIRDSSHGKNALAFGQVYGIVAATTKPRSEKKCYMGIVKNDTPTDYHRIYEDVFFAGNYYEDAASLPVSCVCEQPWVASVEVYPLKPEQMEIPETPSPDRKKVPEDDEVCDVDLGGQTM